MTSLTFYGGVDEIGGNKILLEDLDTRIFLDFGMSFGQSGKYFSEFHQPRKCNCIEDFLFTGLLPELEGAYRTDYLEYLDRPREERGVDAVLLSHAHMDHTAYIHHLRKDITLHMSPETHAILRTMEETGTGTFTEILHHKQSFTIRPKKRGDGYTRVKGEEAKTPRPVSIFQYGIPFKVGPLDIVPYEVDHSLPGATAYIIHTSEGTILYTGDFRFHGYKRDATEKMIDATSEEDIEAVIVEGTRITEETGNTETDVFNEAGDIIEDTSKLAVVNFPARDLAARARARAQDTNDNDFFKEALNTILGLDVIQTLEKDLRLYAYKQIGSEDSHEVVGMIADVEREARRLNNELGDKFQDQASVKIRLEKTIDIISKKENELSLQGAGYAKKRFEFREKLNKIESELDETRKRLREFYSGLFPFTLVPELCLQLRDRIQAESIRKNELSALTVLKDKRKEFEAKLFERNGQLTGFSDSLSQKNLVDDILSALKEVVEGANDEDFLFINDFSENELNQLLYWVDKTSNTIPREIEHLSIKYDRLRTDRAHYENLLRRVPDDTILNPIVNEIVNQYEMKGRYEHQLEKIEEEAGHIRYKITEKNRELETLNERFEQLNKFERKIRLLRNIRLMLKEYQEVIRENKMEMLRNAFLDSITMILRKHDFISDIKFDKDYHAELQLGDGNYISKSILSNGEKQIYAVSMLLALVKVSGRPLPFVIDTPLARLDSSHRDNIVENFFPNASHQVIIFSTDTEIDRVYFEKLAPHIARVYHLEYDPQIKSSEASEGYFWKPMEVIHD